MVGISSLRKGRVFLSASGNKKSIALLVPDLRGGGAERVTVSLAKEFLDRGYSTDIVVLQAVGELLDTTPPQARIVSLESQRFRNALWPLISYLRKAEPDSILAAMWPLTIVAVLAAKLSGIPGYVAVSDHTALSLAYKDRSTLHRLLLRVSMALFYRLASARIGVSQGVVDDLANLSGIPSQRFCVIHNPVELAKEEHAENRAGADIWGEGEGKRLLNVGSLKAVKNQSLLIEAFEELLKEEDATLAIVGEGPLRPQLEQLIESKGLHNRVLLPGFRKDLIQIYQIADLFVLSSNHEGFGNVIVEALSCGLPIVSTDCPTGPREILADGEYGSLVPCNDKTALATAMVKALRYEHNSRRLRERAAQFLPSIAAKRYLKALFEPNI